MKDNRFLRLLHRLSAWVDGLEPENHGRLGPEESYGVKDTHALEEEYLRNNPAVTRVTRYQNHGLLQRYTEWEAGRGAAVFGRFYMGMAVLICVVLSAILLLTVSFLPPFGDPGNPANNEVFVKYIEDTLKDTNATNVVAGIILDYRAFDTFGESSVLFIAACAVTILLRRDGEAPSRGGLSAEMDAPRQDKILTKVSMLVIPVVMLYGIYVILNGHISPGGGFSGGTIIGAGLILYLSAFGTAQVRRFLTYRRYLFINFFALCFYAIAKGYSFYTGANHLESGIPFGTPGAILSGGLILPLNIAVGIVVACTMYGFYALYSKGEI